MHVHNLGVQAFERNYRFCEDAVEPEYYPPEQMRYFMGYERPDGRVGTRNYLLVISTVNCSASVSSYVARRFEGVSRDYPNVDGVMAITHKGGCGVALGSEDYFQLQRTLAGFAKHPNVFGYVIIGLGCEVNQTQDLIVNESLGRITTIDRPPKVITIQGAGGTQAAVEMGVQAVAEMLLGRTPAEGRNSRSPS
ncbi:MAG: hypothetical protein KatS3mg115_2101 [Candidatus Poribacteria bacterium]|nr:MAG: hypothetical protein KatS3mg115_2101 [Candidatus Poribacteria bacterium]